MEYTTFSVTPSATVTAVYVDVVDNNDKTTSATLSLNMGSAYGLINTWTNILLGAQSNANGSYFASSTGTVFTSSTAPANVSIIDIAYTVLSGTESLVSPSITTISGNITSFVASTVTAAQFNAMTNDSILTSISNASATSIGITSGGVYAFVNSAGKKGLVNVTALVTGTSGTATIAVKVQK